MNYRQKIAKDLREIFREIDALCDGVDSAIPNVEESEETSPIRRALEDQEDREEGKNAQKAGVPVYIAAANRGLCDIVKNSPRSLEALKAIQGFGKGKVAKYGKDVINISPKAVKDPRKPGGCHEKKYENRLFRYFSVHPGFAFASHRFWGGNKAYDENRPPAAVPCGLEGLCGVF